MKLTSETKEKPFLSSHRAIRVYCFFCSGKSFSEVRSCPSVTCSLWRFRLGTEVENEATPRVTRSRAIILRCQDCCGKTTEYSCSITDCALYKLRSNKSRKQTRKEQPKKPLSEKDRERFRKLRESK